MLGENDVRMSLLLGFFVFSQFSRFAGSNQPRAATSPGSHRIDSVPMPTDPKRKAARKEVRAAQKQFRSVLGPLSLLSPWLSY